MKNEHIIYDDDVKIKKYPKWATTVEVVSNNLKTLNGLPKRIYNLYVHPNPLQNLNALLNINIILHIYVDRNINSVDYWLRALDNTDLSILEWHYYNHKYYASFHKEIVYYLEELIKIKRIEKDYAKISSVK